MTIRIAVFSVDGQLDRYTVREGRTILLETDDYAEAQAFAARLNKERQEKEASQAR